MCKVYTEYHGTSEIEHGLCACIRSIIVIPSLKLGDYLSVQAHKPCSVSYLVWEINARHEVVAILKDHSIALPAAKRLTPNCTTIHRYPIFSTRYSVICKVYTGYCGTSEIEHGLWPVRSIIPSLKLGDYLSVQAHKPCYISHLL